ncbi:MAG: metallophosphoesterase [Spirochaetales bacterium]|nr:metallophosphoesterase [Spirochaetales bacterium]
MVFRSKLIFLFILFVFSFFLISCNNDIVISTLLVPDSTDPVYKNVINTPYLNILAIGDSGSGTENQRAVSDWMNGYALENQVTAVILAGDNFYENGVTSVDDPLFASRFENMYDRNLSDIPFYPVLGNHDIRGDIDAQILYSDSNPRWKMPSLYYCFTYTLADATKIEFIALDSNIIMEGNSLADSQDEWLHEVLSVSDADWKIVYAHHPLYSNGDHGNNEEMIIALGTLLGEYNVDLFIAGHDHDLQVLKPVSGVHYFVSGAAGKTRDTTIRENTLYGKGTFGFMALEIKNTTIVVKVIVQDGVVDYSCVIEK